MAMMMGDLRTALIEAGASQASADKGASEAATYDGRMAKIEADLGLLKWMVGTLYPLIFAILLKLFLR